MKRRLLIALFALGTLGGFGSAAAQMSCHDRARQSRFEHHVAKICADAARRPAAVDQDDDGPFAW